MGCVILNVGLWVDFGRELNCDVWFCYEFEDVVLFGCGDGNGIRFVLIMVGVMGVVILDEECKGFGYFLFLVLFDDGFWYDVVVVDVGWILWCFVNFGVGVIDVLGGL